MKNFETQLANTLIAFDGVVIRIDQKKLNTPWDWPYQEIVKAILMQLGLGDMILFKKNTKT